jgi:hypothetical protein
LDILSQKTIKKLKSKTMAQQSDTLGTVIKVGIVAGLVLLAVLIYRWMKGYNGGDTLFGPSKTPGGGGGGNQAGGAAAGNVFDRLNNAYTEKIANPLKEDVTAAELVIANAEAKKFNKTFGTNVWINRALKSAMELPDNQFMISIKRWLELSKVKDFYQTDLVGANISNTRRSDFITRFSILNGDSKAATDAHYANGGAVPSGALVYAGAGIGAALNGAASQLGLVGGKKS